MKVMITGGSGYLGESIFRHLNSHYPELEVVNYDNLSKKNYSFFINNKFNSLKARFVQGDILDTHRLFKEMENIDVVIHLAGLVTTPFADHSPQLFEQNNHWGASSIITAIEQSNVRRVIYLSTATIYGNTEEPVDENSEPNPEAFYCVSKFQAEKQFQRIAEDREVFILRSGNVYGWNSSMRMDAFINKFMFEGHFVKKIKVTGSGEQKRPVIHVDKLAQVMGSLIEGNQVPGVYNIAEHNFSINQVTEQIQALYPEMDIVYSSQNMPMRSLELKLPCSILIDAGITNRTFEEELKEMKERFSFEG